MIIIGLALILVSVLTLLSYLLLNYVTQQFQVVDTNSLIVSIDAILPQTQCGQCGYTGCLPYATTIAQNKADINQCPPGGKNGIQALAHLLNRPVKPLNPENGIEIPKKVALIDEMACIGCTLCLCCPVDAIIGTAKQMHTVIISACTGCELCVPHCPVDCIQMVVASSELLCKH